MYVRFTNLCGSNILNIANLVNNCNSNIINKNIIDKETRTSKEMASLAAETNIQESVNSLVSRDRRDSTVSNESNVSRLSINRRELDRNLAFEPEGPSGPVGPWKDRIVVDILSVGGEDFKGTLNRKEAKLLIYKKCIGLSLDMLHGIEVEWKGHPVVTFKLEEKLNVDEYFSSDIIEYEKKSLNGDITIVKGKIRGLRLEKETFMRGDEKRLKIKNCKWSVKESDIVEWLENYGKIISPIVEEVLDDSDKEDFVVEDLDDEDDYDKPIGTGNLWVTVKLRKRIPQFVPMMGKKVEIYHRGMLPTCIKCYCEGEKRSWLDYVEGFIIENRNIDLRLYGRWTKILKVTENKEIDAAGGEHEENVEKFSQEETRSEGNEPGEEQGDEESTIEPEKTSSADKEGLSEAGTLPEVGRKEDQAERAKNTQSYRTSRAYKQNTGTANQAEQTAKLSNQKQSLPTSGRGKKTKAPKE
jgi:hypothetical protein